MATQALSRETLHRKTMGCWLGKAVGGTLGQNFEGQEGPLAATFYTPVPDEMIPNDDLDIQVVWAYLLDREERPRVSRDLLRTGWLEHIEFPWNEYGVGIRNLRAGIRPPWSGSHDNWYRNGEGAVIRTEIWACLAAGDPELAARYAYEDACIDHADDGLNAALFMASIEAAAFTESDVDALLDIGMSAIPADSVLARTVADTRKWCAEGLDWQEVRAHVMQEYGSVDFTDVRMNTAFFVIGWLLGRDFSERILICNNCGQDTDSSTASLGAVLGIIDPDGIPQEWLEPIGRDLVLSPEIVGIEHPATLDGFTDLVLDLRERIDYAEPEFDDPGPAPVAGLAVQLGFTDFLDRAHIGSRFLPKPHEAMPEMPAGTRETYLDGTVHRMARADFESDVAVINYRFRVDSDRRVRVMFNTTEQMIAWLDGEFAFARETGGRGEAGSMCPAVHGPPVNQSVVRSLSAGEHELRVLVRRPVQQREAEWVVGCADPQTGMWLDGAFDNVIG